MNIAKTDNHKKKGNGRGRARETLNWNNRDSRDNFNKVKSYLFIKMERKS